MNGEDSENRAAIVPTFERSLPFQLLETRPESITWHMIFDHELDKLVNISRPITTATSTLLLGAMLGLLPSTLDIIQRAQTRDNIDVYDLALLGLAAICLAAGAVTAFYACRGQLDATAIRNAVRGRNAIHVSPPVTPQKHRKRP